MLEARIIEGTTGEIVERILTPCGKPEDYRRRTTGGKDIIGRRAIKTSSDNRNYRAVSHS